MKPLIAVVGFIIVLSGYGLMTSGINDWTLLTYATGVVDGARVERVVIPASSASTANEAWYRDSLAERTADLDDISGSGTVDLPTGVWAKVEQQASSGAGCRLSFLREAAGTGRSNKVGATSIYSQSGSALTTKADNSSTSVDDIIIAGCTWKEPSGIWSSFGFQDLIRLAFQAAALGLPLAVLFGVYRFGRNFMGSVGVHPLLGVVSLIILFLLATRLLDTMTPFVAGASDAVGAIRFIVYQEGLGTLGTIMSNFYGVVLAASLLPVGWEVFKLFQGASSGSLGASVGGGRSM